MITYIKQNREIFQCPVCKSDLDIEDDYIFCKENNHKYYFSNDIPLMYADDNEFDTQHTLITHKERMFYEKYPFPNYEEFDNTFSLMAKAEKSGFAKALNEELPFNSRILEVGCGTGQLTNFLSIVNREVIGVDLSFNSLSLGSKFRKEHQLERSSFYQMNLFKPIFKDNSFHTIISNGVLHHTPNPLKGLKSISGLLKKNGYIIIDLYNRIARFQTHLRRNIFNVSGSLFRNLDPYLRRKDIGNFKKEIWFMDQYKNPHETSHSMSEVLTWFDKTGLEFISSIPEIIDISENQEKTGIFTKRSSGNKFTRKLTEILMSFKRNNEGGFFIMIGKKT